MKKLLALLLSVLLLLTFAACGNGEEGGKDSKKSDSNTYETPMELTVKYANSKDYKEYDNYSVLNGFCEEEMKSLAKIMGGENGNKERFENNIKNNKEMFGDDYEFSYKVKDKSKLDKDVLSDYENTLIELASDIQADLSAAENFDSYDWDNAAVFNGISVEDLKKAVPYMKAIGEILKDCEVTAGYTLSLEAYTTGSKLEEKQTDTRTDYVVLEINGRWVSFDDLAVLNDVTGIIN